jgi:hypothetical protein
VITTGKYGKMLRSSMSDNFLTLIANAESSQFFMGGKELVGLQLSTPGNFDTDTAIRELDRCGHYTREDD